MFWGERLENYPCSATSLLQEHRNSSCIPSMEPFRKDLHRTQPRSLSRARNSQSRKTTKSLFRFHLISLPNQPSRRPFTAQNPVVARERMGAAYKGHWGGAFVSTSYLRRKGIVVLFTLQRPRGLWSHRRSRRCYRCSSSRGHIPDLAPPQCSLFSMEVM